MTDCTCNECCYARKHPQFGPAPHPVRVLHCWEDGPRSDDDDYVGSTCMLPAGHVGEHRFMRDDKIGVSFKTETRS